LTFIFQKKQESTLQKKAKVSLRDSRLAEFESWCLKRGISISKKVEFSRNCIAGHGLKAKEKIENGEELVRISKENTISKSALLSDAFKRFVDVDQHKWVPVILSLMAEKSAKHSEFDGYINWLPDKLENLPHFWTKNEHELNLLGLKEQIQDDNERLENDWILGKKVISKFPDRFGNKNLEDLKKEFKLFALLMMSYSFTEPENEEETKEDLFCATESTENEEAGRFMLPVGDLLNHAAENNARIELDESDHTINAIREIESGEEIFNSFGEMSNSRLLHMYGFAEKENDADDAFLAPESIKKGIEEFKDKIPAIQAKLKLLEKHGFFEEGIFVPRKKPAG